MKREHPYWKGYHASENGSVYGRRGRELRPIKHHTGYLVMTLMGDAGIQKQMRIHRFVWECFNGLIEGDLVINHINGIKTDNRLSNLELVTNQENVIHAWQILGRESTLQGEGSPNSKLTEADALEVIRLCKEGYSNKVIGDKFGLHPNYVSLIRHNRRWRHLPR